MELRKPKSCPQCGSTKLAQILYGRSTAEGMEAAGRGEVLLGGCFASQNGVGKVIDDLRNGTLDNEPMD
jgi:hypothetical protein